MTTVPTNRYVGVPGRDEYFDFFNINPVYAEGGDGTDYLWGHGGNDTLYGQEGSDIVRGDHGNDTLYGDFTFDDGVNGITGGAADHILGGFGSDAIYASTGNDFINGEEDNDLIYGGTGDDVLWGGSGVDYLYGGDGNDIIYGATNTAFVGTPLTITLEWNGLNDTASLSNITAPIGAIVPNDASTDVLDGGAGNDTLIGGAGIDVMYGGLGNDIFWVDNVDDTVIEVAGEGIDTVRSTAVAYELRAEIEYGALDAGGILLVGNSGDNWLGGNAGDNTLFGQGGNDTIVGGLGADNVFGGAGADKFYFASISETGDTIQDFQTGIDDMLLQGGAFDFVAGSPLTAGLNFIAAAGMPAPTNSVATLLYSTNTGNLFWDPDGSGANGAVFIAYFNGAPALSTGDFLIA